MGASSGDFQKYPKTLHLHGSKLAKDDKVISEQETRSLLKRLDLSFVWESKLDGTNVGISYSSDGQLIVQNRGHILKHGEHVQYNILRSWAATFSDQIKEVLGSRYIMYGEWCYAVHTVRYSSLRHYFNEFDIYDKEENVFLSTPKRIELLLPLIESKIIVQVPVVHTGNLTLEDARKLMENHGPIYGEDKPEGLYLKVEQGDIVFGRYKLVREEFIQQIIDEDTHWKSRPVEVQGLAAGVDIFAIN